jgi:hypothetical protein
LKFFIFRFFGVWNIGVCDLRASETRLFLLRHAPEKIWEMGVNRFPPILIPNYFSRLDGGSSIPDENHSFELGPVL